MLLKTVDGLLAGLVFVLPFIMGGREAWGCWFLITAALALGAAWGALAAVSGQRLKLTGIELLFVAGLGLVWFQTQPQTQATLNTLSPEYQRLLTDWPQTQLSADSDAATAWSTTSLFPSETRSAWWVLLAYGVIYVVAIQRIRTVKDCHRMLKWVGLSAMLMTCFAVLQLVGTNGKFFWFYENPYTGTDQLLKGAFTNRNHFAHFLAMGIGPLLWWLTHTQRAESQGHNLQRSMNAPVALTVGGGRSSSFAEVLNTKFLLLLSAVSLVSFCILVSLSRGGMLSAVIAFVVALTGLWRSLKLKGTLPMILIGGGLMLIAMLAVFGQDQIQVRVDQLVSADADNIDHSAVRRAIWAADWSAIRAFPVLGTGIGSHGEVYSTYMTNLAEYPSTQFTHAESCYIQVAMEAGFIGLGLVVAGLLLVAFRLLLGFFGHKSSLHRACIAAVAASFVADMLHAGADFLWYVPAIVVIGIVLLATGLAASRRTSAEPSGMLMPRPAWAVMAVVCVVALVQVQPQLFSRIESQRHWYAYLRDVFNERNRSQESVNQYSETVADNQESVDEAASDAETEDAVMRTPGQVADYGDSEEAKPEEEPDTDIPALRRRISLLMAAVRADPEYLPPRVALSSRMLELFEAVQAASDTPLALNQVRNAAVSADFGTVEELHEWLERAFGKRMTLAFIADRMSRESLRLCPLSGNSYRLILETGFLRDPADSRHDQLLEQLVLIRGHDPRIRFIVGREAMLKGNLEEALVHWRHVFHSSDLYRRGIVRLLAPQVPSHFFIASFEPGARELQDLLEVYDGLGRTQDSELILQRLCQVIPQEVLGIEDPDKQLNLMLVAFESSQRLQQTELAEQLLRSAIEQFPTAYKPRYFLALLLMEQQRFDEAITHLEWCYDVDPGNVWLPKLIQKAQHQSIQVAIENAIPTQL